MQKLIERIPVIGPAAVRVYSRLIQKRASASRFPGSAEYWEERYAAGGTSGVGSYEFFAAFKAEVLNHFVDVHNVRSVIEFGCGDGNQLRLATYPTYLGFDLSKTAIARCREVFEQDQSKAFRLMADYNGEVAELSISLDVIYHLVEDAVFDEYMRLLFRASNRYVVIYASDGHDGANGDAPHVRHRTFSKWVNDNQPTWTLVERIPNRYPYRGDYRTGSFADFFFYERSDRLG